MKKIYMITLALLSGSSLFAQFGQLQNGGFENWSNVNLYDYVNQWRCSNEDYSSNTTAVKSTDAQIGTYSVQLATEDDGSGNTNFGYVFLGGIGQMGPAATFPYSPTFNTVKFYYKSNLLSDDLNVLVMRNVGGTTVSMDLVPTNITAVQSTWTEVSVSIPAGVQDSMFFALVMGDPINTGIFPAPGSWVKVDNVRLFNGASQTTALPNDSFENWSTMSSENADAWYDSDIYNVSQGINGVTKTNDAHSGTYAARLENSINAFGDTISAMLSVAPFTGAIGIPYNATPTTISGWYKYSTAGADNGSLYLGIYDHGNTTANASYNFVPAASYTQFSVPINYMPGTPDTINIFFNAGASGTSVLYLDDLSLSGGTVGLNEMVKYGLSVYPNPAETEVLIFTEGEFSYEVISSVGEVVRSNSNVNGLQTIALDDVQAGTYIVRLTSNGITQIEKLVIQ